MTKFVVRLGALALAAFLIVSGSSPRPVVAANEPYLIGAVVSESGPGSTLGRPEADSIQMAVDEINKAGGVNGHPLQASILDDESNPTTAVNDVRKLLDQHPVAIIGSSLTQTSLAMVPLTQAASVPLVSLASSSQVIQPVSERRWVFKMPITDFHVAQAMQEYMRKHKQTKV
ncbi:MAG TPA: ABC transporter substrate-binding protein, partial [Candidatus Elarobacter sp.]